MQIQAVKVQRLYIQVADQIMKAIKAGEIPVGSRLPSERDLAGKFGVSRPTIREAMIAMEIAGVIEIRSGSGVYVAKTPPADQQQPADTGAGPFEILEARMIVEGEAVALAAERISKSQLRQLAKLLQEMERDNQIQADHEEADERFHQLIAEASGNSVMASTVNWLWQLRNESEISQLFHQRLRNEGIKPIISDHQAIYDALAQSDARKARRAMHRHLQRVIDGIIGNSIEPTT